MFADPLLPVETGSTRENRFPSVEERLRLYMGNWYSLPCPKSIDAAVYFEHMEENSSFMVRAPSVGNATIEILSTIEADRVFHANIDSLRECAKIGNVPKTTHGEQENKTLFQLKKKALVLKNMRRYCLDVLDSLIPAFLDVLTERTDQPVGPLLVQFGDLQHSHVYGFLNIPHFKKFRLSTTREEIKLATASECISGGRKALPSSDGVEEHMQPIVWKLSVARHYNSLVLVESSDTPWDFKKPLAVFRGELTGSLHSYSKETSDEENCLQWRRCRLVFRHYNSSLIDARLTSTRKRIPNILNGVPLVGEKISLSEMMEYKAVIMLDGNGKFSPV